MGKGLMVEVGGGRQARMRPTTRTNCTPHYLTVYRTRYRTSNTSCSIEPSSLPTGSLLRHVNLPRSRVSSQWLALTPTAQHPTMFAVAPRTSTSRRRDGSICATKYIANFHARTSAGGTLAAHSHQSPFTTTYMYSYTCISSRRSAVSTLLIFLRLGDTNGAAP